MVDNTIALGIRPLQIDLATPLMQVAKIRQADSEARMNDINMKRDVIGAEVRGLAPYLGTPEFDARHQEAGMRLRQQGVLDNPQAIAGWETDAKTPLGIKAIIARTQSPEMAFRQKEAERSQENIEREFKLKESEPKIVPFGSGVMNRKGEMIREPSGEASVDPKTLEFMARQYMAGDTSVLTNLGRGAQGAQNVIALRKEIARLNTESGLSGSDQAMRNAEMFGVKAGQRAVGTRGAAIELAATEFKQILPVVLDASKSVSRTNYPDLNKIIQAFEEKTGDPNIVKFGGGINTLINIYARAINPTGVPTVEDKKQAREILQKAWSQGQFEAATGMMVQEIDAALTSPDKVRDAMRKRFLEGQPDVRVGPPLVTGKDKERVTGPAKSTAQGAPVEGARQAQDGKWYVPDPNRPGKYLQVQ